MWGACPVGDGCPGSHCKRCFDQARFTAQKATIAFATGSALLSPSSRRALDGLARLATKQNARLFLCLKCFSHGTNALFSNRQAAVVRYLQGRGVAANKIDIGQYCRARVATDRLALFAVTAAP